MRILIFIFLLQISYSQKLQKNAIVHGKNLAYQITAPSGWLLDIYSGLNDNLPAVLYKPGSNWKTAKTVMYTNVAYLEESNQSYQTVIESDLKRFREGSAKILIEQKEPIEFSEVNKKADVYYFLDSDKLQFEAVAYLQEAKVVMMFVMASKSEDEFYENLDSFREFTLSCIFLTDRVGESEPPVRKKN
ncbi:MAG: hypothetical protein KDD94_01825 [Calditrichaeota bacterium]|nr:hypothetical protein [Calditrichota bacterium]